MNDAMKNPLIQLLMIGAGIAVVIAVAGKQAIAALADVNKGTPYEGSGAVGTLGNAANTASGGALGGIGSWLGTTLFDLTHSNDTSLLFYSVTFPDGSKHAVDASKVSSGKFVYAGLSYNLIHNGNGYNAVRI